MKTRKKFLSYSTKEYVIGSLFVSPWIIGFLLFIIIPMAFSLFLSFTQWSAISGLEGVKWVGLKNYYNIFTNDPKFYKSLSVTFEYALISVPLSQILALAIAQLLNQKVRGLKFFRSLYFLPSIVPVVAVSLMWSWIFNGQFGILNRFLAIFGIQGPDWLNDPNTALFALIIMGLWGVGSTMIIYLAGLQAVPIELYEAAKVDGCPAIKSFFSITLPIITPTIFFNVVMGVIGSMQYFAQANVMTQGGPLDSTLFYSLYIYNTAFTDFKMGYASALAWIMFIIILLLTLIIFKSSNMWVFYDTEVKKKKKAKKEAHAR